MPLDGALFSNTKPLVSTDSFLGENKPFLIVSYGLGRDSTAVLIRLAKLGIRPDMIIFADLSAEKSESYAYLKIINSFLRSVGFPEVTVIKLYRKRDADFESHLFRLGIFPSFTYGKSHSCSATWKVEAMDNYLKTHPDVIKAKSEGRQIVRAVGFELNEIYRIKDDKTKKDKKAKKKNAASCKTVSAFSVRKNSPYTSFYPLIEWGVDFDGVLDIIWEAGLSLPPKSSCYYCPAMTLREVYDLSVKEPHLFFKALVLERIVQRNKIVPHDRRVQGLRFGEKWSDYPFAAPFLSRIDEVIEVFQLDRTFECGDKRRFATGWMAKSERVRLFRECFSSAERLHGFLANRLDISPYAAQINESIGKHRKVDRERIDVQISLTF